MIADRPLPMTVPLEPRETAFSYMSRLAARNELSAVDFGRYTGVTFTKVLRGDPETMKMLASRGGIDCHDLQAWSPSSIANDARYEELAVWQLGFPAGIKVADKRHRAAH